MGKNKIVWEEINTIDERPFVLIGKGMIIIPPVTCNLISNIGEYRYVSFLKTKIDRVFYIGFKFQKQPNIYSTEIEVSNGEALIKNQYVLYTLFGREAVDGVFSRREALFDPNNPEILMVYNCYKDKLTVVGSNKPIRGKHIGSIVCDCWEVVSCAYKDPNGKKSPTYLLRNIKTGEEVRISSRALFDIEKGITTVNNVLKARKEGIHSYNGKKRYEKKKRVKKLPTLRKFTV